MRLPDTANDEFLKEFFEEFLLEVGDASVRSPAANRAVKSLDFTLRIASSYVVEPTYDLHSNLTYGFLRLGWDCELLAHQVASSFSFESLRPGYERLLTFLKSKSVHLADFLSSDSFKQQVLSAVDCNLLSEFKTLNPFQLLSPNALSFKSVLFSFEVTTLSKYITAKFDANVHTFALLNALAGAYRISVQDNLFLALAPPEFATFFKFVSATYPKTAKILNFSLVDLTTLKSLDNFEKLVVSLWEPVAFDESPALLANLASGCKLIS